jgi:hypothetical protein
LNTFLQKNNDFINKLKPLFLTVERFMLSPLNVYFKLAGPRNERKSTLEDEHQMRLESLLRLKINECLIINIDFLVLLMKIYKKFSETTEKLYFHKFDLINNCLSVYNKQIYDFYSQKIIPQKFFSFSEFQTDFDVDASSFRFINEYMFKLNKLKEIFKFSFDDGYYEIMKILNKLLNIFSKDFEEFIKTAKKKCVYGESFEKIFEDIQKSNTYKEIKIQLEYKKYDKENFPLEEKCDEKVKETIKSFLIFGSRKGKEEANFHSKNYKLMELMTKLVFSIENLCHVTENFIFDVMKTLFSSAKITALMEQANSMSFFNINESIYDLSTMIINNLKTIDKISIDLSRLVLLNKLEFLIVSIGLIRNIQNNDYWLYEPQMNAENFVHNFINEFNIYDNLFQYNTNTNQYKFIREDYFLIVNDLFVWVLSQLSSINLFGINLLLRDFDQIKDRMKEDDEEFDQNKFKKCVQYFPNYIKLSQISNNTDLLEALINYQKLKSFNEDFISPIFNLQTNTRTTMSGEEKNKIIKVLFK